MKKLLSIILLFQLCMYAFAEGEPTGKKPDTMLFGDVKSNGEHIPFATISVAGTTIGTSADISGHYKLIGALGGEQTIVFSAVGYRSANYKITLKDGFEVTLSVELEPDMIGLEQVVVSADRSEKSRRDAPTIISTISPRLFERTQSVTLSEGLIFTPGVRLENNCQNCGFSQVRMNGLEGPYSQILINSRPVFSGLAGVYGLELIPSNMIDRVEVVRGGGSALFGSNAIAGTINLITKDPVSDSYTVGSSMSLIGRDGTSDYNLSLNGSVVSSDFDSGLSFYGFLRKRDPFDANGDSFSEMSKIENNTLGASFFQQIGSRSKINIDYFYINESRRGGNNFDKPNHEADISEAVGHRINSLSATFDKLMNEHDKLSFYTAFQNVNRNSYYGAQHDLSAYGATRDFSFTAGGQLHKDLEKFLFLPAELVVGVEMTSNSLQDEKPGYLDLETMEHVENTVVADQTKNSYGFYAQNEWVADKFHLSLGFRAEHYEVIDKQDNGETISGDVVSPRVSLLLNISDNFQLRSSFAKGYRAPQIFDEDLHIETSGARRVTHENDPNLKQETSNSYTFSLDYSTSFDKWQVQLLGESFYTKLENPFVNEYGEPDTEGNVVYTRTNAEDGAIVQGVNVEINVSAGAKFTWQSGFTIQKSEYELPQEFNEKRFFRTPETYGYVTLTYSPGALVKASVTGNYTGKMLVPYFGNTLVSPEAGELRSSDPFYDLGIKLSHDFRLKDELSLQLYGGVKNVFDSFQNDFDYGIDRDPGYVYGPLSPRTFYVGIKFGNLL